MKTYVNTYVSKMIMNFRAWISGSFIAAAFCCLADDGSTAYNFLDVTSSSRVYGLGGINISLIDDDINLIEQNPAFLGPELGKQVGVNYMRYLGDSDFAGVRYGMAAGEKSAWAVAVQYFGYGEIRGTDETGADIGSFSPKDIYVAGTFGHDITDRLRGGITLKAIYSSYESYTAFAMATDLGISYFDSDRDLSLSLVITNLGGQLKRFNDVYDRLPVAWLDTRSRAVSIPYIRNGMESYQMASSIYRCRRRKCRYDAGRKGLFRLKFIASSCIRHGVYACRCFLCGPWIQL